MSNRSTSSVFAFYLRQQLYSGRWLLGLVILIGVYAAGVLWSDEGRGRLASAMYLSAIVALNFGLAHDRRRHFETFLINFVPSRSLLFTKLLVTLLLYVALFLIGFVMVLAIIRDLRMSIWYVCQAFLLTGFIATLSLLVEMLVDTELPGVLAALIFTLTIVFVVTTGEGKFVETIGIDVNEGSYGSMARLAAFLAVWTLFCVGSALSVWAFRHRKKLIRPSA